MHPALSAEVVLVEWAPPNNRPPLRNALTFSPGLPPVRIISVPAGVHDALPHAAQDGFPQFYAKNVGMRRARGEYLLVTNGDVLLGEVLIGTLARRELDPESFYRIDRHVLIGMLARRELDPSSFYRIDRGVVLVGMLARRELDPGSFYRIDRHDLLERFRPKFDPDLTAAAERALAKVGQNSPLANVYTIGALAKVI
ncbi:hypothetical protein T484DRAFT_1805882 [Baffinella frigidus]|nr:hypothetical protein T484DRAFT_1805882 [Cryptophyta sp. CCMP2293]